MTNDRTQIIKLVCLGAKNPETIRIADSVKRVNPNFSLMGFIDNDRTKWGQRFFGYQIFGGVKEVKRLTRQGVLFCNIITGSTKLRYETSKEILNEGGELTNLIHPDVDLRMIKLGRGNYIQNNVLIQSLVVIGDNSSIHIGAIVSHETKVGHSVFIAPGANIMGEVIIEDGVFVGAGSTILPRLIIGKWSIIGAGAIITKNVPPYSVVVGNPGRIIKQTEVKYPDGKIY